jgi:hypothetical protein
MDILPVLIAPFIFIAGMILALSSLIGGGRRNSALKRYYQENPDCK